jgi:hypothetical protein
MNCRACRSSGSSLSMAARNKLGISGMRIYLTELRPELLGALVLPIGAEASQLREVACSLPWQDPRVVVLLCRAANQDHAVISLAIL